MQCVASSPGPSGGERPARGAQRPLVRRCPQALRERRLLAPGGPGPAAAPGRRRPPPAGDLAAGEARGAPRALARVLRADGPAAGVVPAGPQSPRRAHLRP